MTCRYGCKYKGEGCLSGPQPPVAGRSQEHQASLERCAQANKQEIEEPLLVEADGGLEEPLPLGPRSGNRMNSVARTGDCRVSS